MNLVIQQFANDHMTEVAAIRKQVLSEHRQMDHGSQAPTECKARPRARSFPASGMMYETDAMDPSASILVNSARRRIVLALE